MKKYDSINMNPKLIKHGGRKAPKITINEFKKIIEKLGKMKNSPLLYEYDEEDLKDMDVWNLAFGYANTCEKIQNEVYPAYFENIIDDEGLAGFHTLDNGFTFFGVYGGPDYAGASFYIMYYDGKNLRGYVPKYGNTVIIDCKGFENEAGEQWDAEEKHYKKWYKSPDLFNLTEEEIKEANEQIKFIFGVSLKNHLDKLEGIINNVPLFSINKKISYDDFREIPVQIAYRLANGYPLSDDLYNANDINWKAIETDIKARIEIY